MSEVLLTPLIVTPDGAGESSKSSAARLASATYVVLTSVTVTVAPSRLPSAREDGSVVIDASGSATALTSSSPVVMSPLPVCPEARTLTPSFAASSKSPAKPSVRTATVAEVLLTRLIVTPEGALASSKSSVPSCASATYAVLASVTVTVAPSRFPSAREDGVVELIDASGSATAVTSISPVVTSPLPVCPEARTLTLSFASASKSPVKPSVRTAAVAEVLLTPLIVTPSGLLASSKSVASRLASATYVVPTSVTVTVAPSTLLSVRGSRLWPVMDAEISRGVARAESLAGPAPPAGALAASARTWKSYALSFVSPVTVASIVAAVAPGTAVHEPHVCELASLYRYSQPVINALRGSGHASATSPSPGAARSTEGFAGAVSAVAPTATAPVSRSEEPV